VAELVQVKGLITMSKAIRVHAAGGPQVLSWEDVDVGEPQQGEVRLRQTAVGLNYIDAYHRSGLYPIPMPGGLGLEAAGIVEAVGEGVRNVTPGDRVAYAGGPPGAYAQMRVMPAAPLVRLPEAVSEQEAAALMLQGMTAEYLIHRTYKVSPGETVVVHAAAGGVGLILCQWLNSLGATVIGTVGSEAKAELAQLNGCHHPVLYKKEDLAERVSEITGGEKVPVVYDSVGADTWETSLNCLRPRGLLVSFGNTSGPVTGVNIAQLAAKGSVYVTRPLLAHYTSSRQDLEATAARLFEAISGGKVKAHIGQVYDLKDAAIAHRDLEGGKTTGSTLLLP
jgi:NADPH:quinone reductase